jgi:arylsulfatase A-like enzyme
LATNHIVFIVLDSCRYDTMMSARRPNIDRLGAIERRYSYASWTAPSHYAFTMGMLPHSSPKNVFASEVYKEEFQQWKTRTGAGDLSFKDFLPDISLPKVLAKLGYYTVAKVSMPVLNKYTLISRDFDEYKLMPHHNDFAGMVDEIEFPDDEPRYYFLNLGETHYPYMLSGADMPHISGVHGALKAMADPQKAGATRAEASFSAEQLKMLHGQQVRCVEYLDGLIGKLMAKAPENTYFIVTADHGELFGEDGYFGHGPIMHEKCFEIPFVEGRVVSGR